MVRWWKGGSEVYLLREDHKMERERGGEREIKGVRLAEEVRPAPDCPEEIGPCSADAARRQYI